MIGYSSIKKVLDVCKDIEAETSKDSQGSIFALHEKIHLGFDAPLQNSIPNLCKVFNGGEYYYYFLAVDKRKTQNTVFYIFRDKNFPVNMETVKRMYVIPHDSEQIEVLRKFTRLCRNKR